jgi:hypothetical protein
LSKPTQTAVALKVLKYLQLRWINRLMLEGWRINHKYRMTDGRKAIKAIFIVWPDGKSEASLREDMAKLKLPWGWTVDGSGESGQMALIVPLQPAPD